MKGGGSFRPGGGLCLSSQPKWSKLGTNVHIGLNKSEIIKKAEFSDSALIFQVLKLTVYICIVYAEKRYNVLCIHSKVPP